MRAIKYIAIHCTATPQTTTVESILNYWRRRLGWKNPGYHFIVLPNGSYRNLLPVEQVSNGVQGFNSETINISYIGGIDANGRPMDNRTHAQKQCLLRLIKDMKAKFPKAIVQGHRDFPGVKKACPSFNAKQEYANI